MSPGSLIPTHCHEEAYRMLDPSEAASLSNEGKLKLSEAGKSFLEKRGYESIQDPSKGTASTIWTKSTKKDSNGNSTATASNTPTIRASQASTAKPEEKR